MASLSTENIQPDQLFNTPVSMYQSELSLSDLEKRHQDLRNKFKDCDVIIPDFFALMPNWETRVNKVYNEQLMKKTNSWLLDLGIPNTKKTIEGINNALLIACLYPGISEEASFAAARYIGLLYLWDDEFDCGALMSDFEGAKRAGSTMYDLMSYAFGEAPDSDSPPPTTPFTAGLCEVVAEIRAVSTKESLKRLSRFSRLYVNAIANVTQRETGCEIRTFEEYKALRDHSGGGYTMIHLLEYAYGLDIPDSFFENEAVKTMMDEICSSLWCCNDIISLAKEMREDGEIQNVVPILVYHNNLTPQSAIDHTARMFHEHYAAAEEAKLRIPIPTGNPKLESDIRTFIKGCQDMAIGWVRWSYDTSRYFGNGKSYSIGNNEVIMHIE